MLTNIISVRRAPDRCSRSLTLRGPQPKPQPGPPGFEPNALIKGDQAARSSPGAPCYADRPRRGRSGL
ncbi:hypothetical protein Pflav_089330 [Phytohabitans flavus]|uniref:Uncharacterized protein n=1 Tax=Phytohabitans flavus TaxID=1076124 RepID=A0A6F8Y926_9ACTN|nr:hypothetical protein Pflav_089330 [Phytohabitans flavus]